MGISTKKNAVLSRRRFCRPNSIHVVVVLGFIVALAAQSRADSSILEVLKESNSFPYDSLVRDWELQDDVDGSGYKSATESIMAEYPTVASSIESQMQQLNGNGADDADYKDVYLSACAVRRKQRLSPYLHQLATVYFAKTRVDGRRFLTRRRKSDSKGIFILSLDENTGCSEENLFDGRAFDPCPSFDGTRMLFCKEGRNICEMDLETRSIRDITPYDQGKMDIFPVYLPNGNILFASTRIVQVIPCNGGDVFNFYVSDKDGRLFRRIAYDQADVYQPSLMQDGRIVFLRWGYNDRTRWHTFDLFTMKPDGREQTGFYGNASCWPALLAYPRVIPGTNNKVLVALSSKSPKHMEGPLAILDVSKGNEGMDGLEFVGTENPPVDYERHLECVAHYKPPIPMTYNNGFPLSEDAYLAGAKRDYEEGGICGLYFVMRDGQRELLAYDHEVSCTQPVTVIEKPTVLPSAVDYSKNTADCYITDIYFGRGTEGVERGTIKRLRVAALDYRPSSGTLRARTGTGGTTFEPPASLVGGSWDIKRIIGETPVEEDGSVAFEVPALTPVYFQAVDERGYVVQSMREWTTFQPGETASCAGCHESKYNIPAPGTPMASSPKPLESFYGPARGFSYDKEIQPILDKNCIECHNGETRNGKRMRDFRGDLVTVAGRGWNISYLELLKYRAKDSCYQKPEKDCGNGSGINKNRENPIISYYWYDGPAAPLPPYARGAAQSRLMDTLEAGHNGIALSREEIDKMACWIDLAAPYHGDWMENLVSDKVKGNFSEALEKRARYWDEERKNLEQLGSTTSRGRHRFETIAPKHDRPLVSSVDSRFTFIGAPNRDFTITLVDCRGRQLFQRTVQKNTKSTFSLPAKTPRGVVLIRMQDKSGSIKYTAKWLGIDM